MFRECPVGSAINRLPCVIDSHDPIGGSSAKCCHDRFSAARSRSLIHREPRSPRSRLRQALGQSPDKICFPSSACRYCAYDKTAFRRESCRVYVLSAKITPDTPRSNDQGLQPGTAGGLTRYHAHGAIRAWNYTRMQKFSAL